MNNLKELTNILYEIATSTLTDSDFWCNAYAKLEKEYVSSAKRFGKVTNYSEASSDVTIKIDKIKNLKNLIERLKFLINTYDLKIGGVSDEITSNGVTSFSSFNDVKKFLKEIDARDPVKQMRCDKRFLTVIFESKRPIFKAEGGIPLKVLVFIDFFKNRDSTYSTQESAYFK